MSNSAKELMQQSFMPRTDKGIHVTVETDNIRGRMSYGAFVAMLFKPYLHRVNRLDHAIIGLAGETGEVCDEVKQLTIYDKNLNLDKLKVECGDVLFYLQSICNEFGWTFEELCQRNAEKLQARYAQMCYSNQQALDRADGEAKGAGDAQ